MKVIAFNGSPRANWNTAQLLQHALAGAKDQGAETELVHLYELNFRGCVSCFACKVDGGKSYGHCALRDDLTPWLKKLEETDAIILGSPIYLGAATGEMRKLFERLFFPFLCYTNPPQSLFVRKLRAGFIYSLNLTEAQAEAYGYRQSLQVTENVAKIVFGSAETMMCYDTCQFDDYGKIYCPRFDPVHKQHQRTEVFPQECRKAYELGVRLAGGQK